MVAPRTPAEIRDWLDRLGVGHATAGRALGLRDPNRVMRSYCSPVGRDAPADTTVKHMALLETVVLAVEQIKNGRPNMAEMLLVQALHDRFGASIFRRIETTTSERVSL